MGKSKKKRKGKSESKPKTRGPEQDEARLSLSEIQALEKAESELGAGLAPFARGDFVAARALFTKAERDDSLSDDARQRAAELASATRPERTALLVGLGAALMLFLVFAVSQLTQP
jgi:hypothetical protein